MNFTSFRATMFMEKNSIEQICIAETDAEQMVKRANDLAADILAKANDEAEHLIAQTLDTAHKAAAEELEAIHVDNRTYAEKDTADVLNEIDILSEKARAVQPKAVHKIIKALV